LELLELTANIRTTKGNSPARAMRREGNIPAVLYGPGTEPVLISVNMMEMEQILKGRQVGMTFFNLLIKNGETRPRSAMIKELQVHPVSRKLIHADFYEISMDRKISVKVPVTTKGHSVGVELGGILQIIRRELEVFCLPHRIPEVIELDVTDLDIGDSIHVQDIPLDDDIEIDAEVNFTVLTVSSPKVEEEEVEEEEELEEGEEAADGEEETPAESGEAE